LLFERRRQHGDLAAMLARIVLQESFKAPRIADDRLPVSCDEFAEFPPRLLVHSSRPPSVVPCA
jgi:hypothetical protein